MDDNNLSKLLTKLRKPRSHSWLFETISTSLDESLNKVNNLSDYILQKHGHSYSNISAFIED